MFLTWKRKQSSVVTYGCSSGRLPVFYRAGERLPTGDGGREEVSEEEGKEKGCGPGSRWEARRRKRRRKSNCFCILRAWRLNGSSNVLFVPFSSTFSKQPFLNSLKLINNDELSRQIFMGLDPLWSSESLFLYSFPIVSINILAHKEEYKFFEEEIPFTENRRMGDV